jgi:oligoendopeptidase F
MNLLPFGKLTPHRPRRFVPADAPLGEWPAIAPLFDQLEARAPKCATPAELEAWLLDWSELSAALEEEAARRNIAMTCHTDDAEAERAYLEFIEEIEPQLKPRQFALEQLLIAHPQCARLPLPRYEVLLRDVRNHVALYRPENVPLET